MVQGTDDRADVQHRLDALETAAGVVDPILDVTGDNGWTTIRAVGVVYSTFDRTYWLSLQIAGTTDATNQVNLTIADILFKNVDSYLQAGVVVRDDMKPAGCVAFPNTNKLQINSDVQSQSWYISGYFELDINPDI